MSSKSNTTRREFLKQSAVVAAATPLAGAVNAWAADQPVAAVNPPARKIKLGLIGCGGRGQWLADLFQKHGGRGEPAGS